MPSYTSPSVCLYASWQVIVTLFFDYNRSVRSMGRMVDKLDKDLEAIEEEGRLILMEEFTMLIFQGTVY